MLAFSVFVIIASIAALIIASIRSVRFAQALVEEFAQAIWDQNEAIADQGYKQGDKIDDYNLGWLHSFEDAHNRALTELEHVKYSLFNARFSVLFTTKERYVLKNLLFNEKRTRQFWLNAQSPYAEGRWEAFRNWIQELREGRMTLRCARKDSVSS